MRQREGAEEEEHIIVPESLDSYLKNILYPSAPCRLSVLWHHVLISSRTTEKEKGMKNLNNP
jgi:hypothetical protein